MASANPVYLDCNATTPIDPAVRDVFLRYIDDEFGNEGSRTHEFGSRAKQAVQAARDAVGAVVGASRDEVLFTSGATESNNLAILGLADAAATARMRHVVTTSIEHKAVLEPFEVLRQRGFAVTYLRVGRDGRIDPEDLKASLTDETFLVSIMAENNETGIRQPMRECAAVLGDHPAYFHTDAAQAFGKDLDSLREPRIDLISTSGHKLYAPKGIGALVCRKRGYKKPPLRALMVGGGQERGLRPGTLPVAQIAALGMAAKIAVEEQTFREAQCREFGEQARAALESVGAQVVGADAFRAPNVLNLSFGGIDSEALMVSLKDLIAISNGSACTSTSYSPSHVLKAMGMSDDEANACVRFSWCHLTPAVDWNLVAERIKRLS